MVDFKKDDVWIVSDNKTTPTLVGIVARHNSELKLTYIADRERAADLISKAKKEEDVKKPGLIVTDFNNDNSEIAKAMREFASSNGIETAPMGGLFANSLYLRSLSEKEVSQMRR